MRIHFLQATRFADPRSRGSLIHFLPLATALIILHGCAADTAHGGAGGGLGARAVQARFLRDVGTLANRAADLKSALESMRDDSTSIHNARLAFVDARLAYKRVEFLAEQYMPASAKSIDGPVADEVDENDPNHVVEPAEGLQVIEARLFAEHPEHDTTLAQAVILASNIKRLSAYGNAIAFSDGNIFDAMRREVLRVAALGLAGYDAPVALTSLPEGAAALESVRDAYMEYAPALESSSPALRRSLDSLFTNAIADLRVHHDFVAFDRLEFIRRGANPLFKNLLGAAKALSIELADERRALRRDASMIFDAGAFDPYAFAPTYAGRADSGRIELGRLLFFDPILSGNGRRSCASCHRPDRAFTDGRARSIAFDHDGFVVRNAPTLINSALQRGEFYDRRVEFLEDQAGEVLNNPREMHGSMGAALNQLRASDEYARRFNQAFPASGDTAINALNIRIAIASFVRSLVGLDAPFDRYARGESNTLDAAAKRGFNLFMGKGHCGTCHFMPLFNGAVPPAFAETESEIIGVPSRYDTSHALLDPDVGRYAVHHIEGERYMFKVPTLRNVALTAPYMHNGAFATLEEVLDFYNRGGGAGIGIDLPAQTLPRDPLHLTQGEMSDIIAFLTSLTDTTGLGSEPQTLPAIAGSSGRLVGGEY
jgi:cytochrome c peroxidase